MCKVKCGCLGEGEEPGNTERKGRDFETTAASTREKKKENMFPQA